jgi:uncharacterized protein YjiK
MCVQIRTSIIVFLAFVVFLGCKQGESEKYPSPPEYNFYKPVTIHLKGELDEISGIIFYPKDTSLFAINDEFGRLYKIYIRDKVQIERWKFSDAGDYEDVALVDSTFYVLKSKGNIYSFKVLSKDSVVVDDCKSPYTGNNEFETLYYDSYYQKLVLLCKDCKEDDKKVVTAWAFDPRTKTYSDTPFYTLDAKEILKKLDNKKEERFKPSAAAVNPITKELYIISSVNKALVIADRNGKLKKVIPLDPKVFKQPEGLTFSAAGDLFISNESADVGPANILIYKTKIPTAKK